MYCRIITGKIAVRELKLGYSANVIKCGLACDKTKIEFPALPEEEFNEVVYSISNHSQKDYMIEIVPPNPKVSGITVNPLVNVIKSGSGTLVSMRYNSKFRDLSYQVMENLNKSRAEAVHSDISGMVKVNKKLAARMKAR